MTAFLVALAGAVLLAYGLVVDHAAMLIVGFLAVLFALGLHALPRQTVPVEAEPVDLIDVSGVDFQWPDRDAA